MSFLKIISLGILENKFIKQPFHKELYTNLSLSSIKFKIAATHSLTIFSEFSNNFFISKLLIIALKASIPADLILTLF